MSDKVSALPGAVFEGFCKVEEAGLQGMVTLRADLSLAKVAKAVKAATGAAMPGRGEISKGAKGRVAWMSPDELLLLVDHAAAPDVVAKLKTALKTSHALVVDVSDARAMFRVTGAQARDVIAKLSPADLRGFGPGQLRRTRLAQVPAAFHMPDDATFEIVCFRSVAAYVFNILSKSARLGGEV
ncbi:MAG TPA: sarcosine oxidase subunit gamma [Aliiroseovarius sp.]|nr:sarcosine oxidase subunit gamma [Aliiroseovarius sp.]